MYKLVCIYKLVSPKKTLSQYLILIYSLSNLLEASSSESSEDISKSSLINLLTIFFLWKCVCILIKEVVNNSLYPFQKENQLILMMNKCNKNLYVVHYHENLY